MPVREGLARLEGVESTSERCNRQTGTAELRAKKGRLLNPTVLSNQIAEIGVGARLRGLEATIKGFVERKDGRPVLRVAKSNEILQLVPLATKVQIDALKTKQPEPPTREEKNAHERLLARVKDRPQPVRITGPLRDGMKLEVRTFELK